MSALRNKRPRVSTMTFEPEIQTLVTANYSDPVAEKALIGAVLVNPDLFYAVSDHVQAADFFYIRHGYIWHAIDKLAGRGAAIDPATVWGELQTIPGGDGVGGIDYLTQLMAATFDTASIEAYAQTVIDNAVRLRILTAADQITKAALDKTLPVEEVMNKCEADLFEATARKPSAPSDMSSLMATYYERVEKGYGTGTPPGVPYGWAALDELTGGLYPGEVTVLAGPPGFGKTTVALSVLRNLARAGRRAVFFSVEMTTEEVIRKLAGMEAEINSKLLKSFQLSQSEWARFVAASGRISTWKTHIIDEYRPLTPNQVRRRLRKLSSLSSVDALIIDGLWLMESDRDPFDTSQRPRERHDEVNRIMTSLSILAKDFQIPILLLHQLNQDAKGRKGKEPMLSDLAESAGAGRTAQNVYGLFRPSYYEPEHYDRDTYAYILKDRTGSPGAKVRLIFTAASQAYTGAEHV